MTSIVHSARTLYYSIKIIYFDRNIYIIQIQCWNIKCIHNTYSIYIINYNIYSVIIVNTCIVVFFTYYIIKLLHFCIYQSTKFRIHYAFVRVCEHKDHANHGIYNMWTVYACMQFHFCPNIYTEDRF